MGYKHEKRPVFNTLFIKKLHKSINFQSGLDFQNRLLTAYPTLLDIEVSKKIML